MKKLMFILMVSLSLSACTRTAFDTPGALVPATVDQDPSLPSLTLNGTQLHLETHGDPTDPIIVVIHGGPGGDYRSMLQATQFAEEGYFVVFYDQRGTGLSERVDRSQFEDENAVQLFIDDLDSLIAHFRLQPTQKVFLMGHSWGAMLATGYINQHPEKIAGAILAEPGGFTWPQTTEYLSRSNDIKFFSEGLNDAVYPEQIFSGKDEHEILDYKAAYFAEVENAPENPIGNAGPYPFWRNGAVSFTTLLNSVDQYPFDFTTDLSAYSPKILFLYSELNTAYGADWATTVSAPYPNVQIEQVEGSGHELLYFGFPDFYVHSLPYLNSLR